MPPLTLIPGIDYPMLKKLLAYCCFAMCTACSPQKEQAVLVFDYDDFGPSVLSHSVIGSPWWQWLPHGDGHPETQYDIRVVVNKYKDYVLPSQYSVSEQDKRDFRIIGCNEAIGYFDMALPMVNEIGETEDKLLKKLERTKQELVKYCN